ncbi:MAG: type II toxin-antitoxin system VapC family toxin [Verrucomicrobiia bacterium]
MKVFLDTNLIVASVIGQHEHHERAYGVLDRVHSGKDEGFVSAHGLAEVYAVLTKLPAPFRHTPEQALLSVEENIIKHFKITSLTATDYTGVILEAALAGVQGGTIYDAVLVKCAAKAEVEKIFTLNVRHFRSVARRSLQAQILAP